eukprot:Em0012g265a
MTSTGEQISCSVRDIPSDKHPKGIPSVYSSLLQDNPAPVNPILFDQLTAQSIYQAALHTKGSAGLSGLDAYAWRRLCSSYTSASQDLCSALASVGKRLCTADIPSAFLCAFVACRLDLWIKTQILQNTYRTSIRVVIPGNGKISSSEGTSQGDPLAMGSCADLRVWWDALCSAGPNFGYHPNPSKTFLVTKLEHAEKAKQLFAGTNVSICAGKRCLGAAIGSKSFTEDLERSYLALPVRLGELGIANPTETSAPAFLASVKLTAPLTSMIVSTGTTEIQLDYNLLQSLKRDICSENHKSLQQKAEGIYKLLPPSLQRCFDQVCEKGSSSWLSALPIADHGFHLNKGEFRDALCLRYDWSLPNVPQHCSCGKQFYVDHAMTCHLGGFLTVRHNDIRDFTASLLTEVCHNVTTEPTLQPLNGETFSYRTANTDAEARADIRARGFWSKGQDAYFEVRVFHPNASSYVSKPLSALFRTHEQAKKREYEQRIHDVEHGVFTPLVFSTSGAMGREATTFYKRLADLLSDKQDKAYSLMGWLRCRLSFAILRSAIICLRGSRSSYHHPVYCDLALAVHEGRVSL